MTTELKNILKCVTKYDILFGGVFSILLIIFRQYYLALIFFIGIIISMLNFIVSSLTINKALNSQNVNKKVLMSLSYFFRIIVVVLIAILFSRKLDNLLAYLIGFITHYGILTFATIKVQKGSE